MENFSQEEVDRMIKEAALAAKQKKSAGIGLNPVKTAQPAVSDKPVTAQPAQKPPANPFTETAQQEPDDSLDQFDVQDQTDIDQADVENEQSDDVQDVFEQQDSIEEQEEDSVYDDENIEDKIEPQDITATQNESFKRVSQPAAQQATANVNPAGLQKFILEVIAELSQTKFQLAQVQIELEMEKLRSQANGFFK